MMIFINPLQRGSTQSKKGLHRIKPRSWPLWGLLLKETPARLLSCSLVSDELAGGCFTHAGGPAHHWHSILSSEETGATSDRWCRVTVLENAKRKKKWPAVVRQRQNTRETHWAPPSFLSRSQFSSTPERDHCENCCSTVKSSVPEGKLSTPEALGWIPSTSTTPQKSWE